MGRVMNRTDLIRTIEGGGCVSVRHGGEHDWYRHPVTVVSQPVPRHRAMKEGLSRHIIKMLSNPADGLSSSQSPENSST
jgi:mRNA interferase HicA